MIRHNDSSFEEYKKIVEYCLACNRLGGHKVEMINLIRVEDVYNPLSRERGWTYCRFECPRCGHLQWHKVILTQ